MAIARENSDAVHLRQGVPQRPTAKTPASRRQIGPSKAHGVFPAEREIDATTERVYVDQHAAMPGAGSRHRKRDGSRGRAGPTTTADNGNDAPGPTAIDSVSETFEQPRLGLWKEHHAFCA